MDRDLAKTASRAYYNGIINAAQESLRIQMTVPDMIADDQLIKSGV